MHYLFTIIILLSSCFDSCKNKALNNDEPFFTVSHIYDSQAKLLLVNVKLKDGMHAYALGEKIGKPVSLQVEKQNGWKALGSAEIPLGEEKTLGGITSVVIEKSFTIKQALEAGEGQTSASLFIQVCSDDFCSKPQTYTFLVP